MCGQTNAHFLRDLNANLGLSEPRPNNTALTAYNNDIILDKKVFKYGVL